MSNVWTTACTRCPARVLVEAPSAEEAAAAACDRGWSFTLQETICPTCSGAAGGVRSRDREIAAEVARADQWYLAQGHEIAPFEYVEHLPGHRAERAAAEASRLGIALLEDDATKP